MPTLLKTFRAFFKRLNKHLAPYTHQVLDALSPTRAAMILLVLAFSVATLGYLAIHGREARSFKDFFTDFYANVGSELAGIAITVLIIDSLNQRRDIKHEKQALILQMSSPENSIAVEAVRILRHQGWLMDGTLQHIDLSKANLQGADLTDADLHGAILTEANLQDAVFWKADLSDSNLVGANLRQAAMRRTNLQRANLHGANLYNAYLYRADLREANLRGAKLQDATLENALLQHSILTSANMQKASMVEADFTEAYMRFADLRGADLWKADFQNAEMVKANLKFASLKGANLKGADLDGANIEGINAKGIQFDRITRLPDGSVWSAEVILEPFIDENNDHFWRSDDPDSPAYHARDETIIPIKKTIDMTPVHTATLDDVIKKLALLDQLKEEIDAIKQALAEQDQLPSVKS